MTITSNPPSRDGDGFNGVVSPRPWPQWRERAASPRIEGGHRLGNLSASSQPLISYVTVTKNASKTLERTITSILKQKTEEIEHIVIDGQSTDGTLDIIKKYEKSIDYYISEKDSGLYEAINKGIELCKGQYICILNADDWLTTHAVKTVKSAIVNIHSTDAIHAFGAWKVVAGSKNKLWPPRAVTKGDILRCADLCHNGIYVPRQVYEKVGPYDTSYRIAADFKWMISASETGINYITHRRPVVFYSLGGISSDGAGHAREAIRIIQERLPELTSKQVEILYDRFHIFQNNKIDYWKSEGRLSHPAVDSINIDSLHSSEVSAYIEAAIQSETSDVKDRIKNRRLDRRLVRALEKLLWRATD